MNKELCLGTAQFGLDYGITNNTGKVQGKEAKLIINKAIKENISYFDTASSYGNSESILGKQIKKEEIKINTKFKTKTNNRFTDEDIRVLEIQFHQTLDKLNKSNIDTYLLHNIDDLKKINSCLLIKWLRTLKKRGFIKRIGISIYDTKDIDEINLDGIEVIQIPVSIYDQRFLNDSVLEKIMNKNISIHIRSIFLQGLLLQTASQWPSHISSSFRNHHANYERKISLSNLTLLESALGFIQGLDFPELVLFGVTKISELELFLEIWNSEKFISNNIDYSNFRWNIKKDIDPRKWLNSGN